MSSLSAKPLDDKETVQQLRACFSAKGSQNLEEAVKYAESLRDPVVKEVALGIVLHPHYLPFSKWTHFDRLVSDFTRVSEDPEFVQKEFAQESQLTRFVCGKSPILTCYRRNIPSNNPDAAEYFFSFHLYDAQPTGGLKLAFNGREFPGVLSLLALAKLFRGYKKLSRAEVVPGTLCLSWPNSDQDLLLMSPFPPNSSNERMQVGQYDPKTLLTEKPDTSGPVLKELSRCTLVETSQFLKRFVEMRDSLRLFSCMSLFRSDNLASWTVTDECRLSHRDGGFPCENSPVKQRLFQIDSPDVSCIAIQGRDTRVTRCRTYNAAVNHDVFMRVQGVWFSCQAASLNSSRGYLDFDDPWRLSNGTTLNLSKGTFESDGHSYSIKKVEPTFDQHGIIATPHDWAFTTFAPALYHPDEVEEALPEIAQAMGLPVGVVRLISQYALGALTLPRGLLASEPSPLFRSMNQCAKLSEVQADGLFG